MILTYYLLCINNFEDMDSFALSKLPWCPVLEFHNRSDTTANTDVLNSGSAFRRIVFTLHFFISNYRLSQYALPAVNQHDPSHVNRPHQPGLFLYIQPTAHLSLQWNTTHPFFPYNFP